MHVVVVLPVCLCLWRSAGHWCLGSAVGPADWRKKRSVGVFWDNRDLRGGFCRIVFMDVCIHSRTSEDAPGCDGNGAGRPALVDEESILARSILWRRLHPLVYCGAPPRRHIFFQVSWLQ